MSDQAPDDLLALIWQKQTTHHADLELIIQKAKTQRLKQRLYIGIDILSLLPFCMIFFLDVSNTPYLKYVFGFLFISSLIVVVYFAKLRWLTAFGSAQNVNEHVKALTQQYKNNTIIARVNKHLGLIMIPLGLLIAIVLSIAKNLNIQETLEDIAIVVGLMSLLMIPWSIWAHRRQKHFERLYDQLLNLYQKD